MKNELKEIILAGCLFLGISGICVSPVIIKHYQDRKLQENIKTV